MNFMSCRPVSQTMPLLAETLPDHNVFYFTNIQSCVRGANGLIGARGVSVASYIFQSRVRYDWRDVIGERVTYS